MATWISVNNFMFLSDRQRRTIYTIFVNFGEEVPKSPLSEAVERMTTETFDKAKEEVLKKVENIHHIYAPPPYPRANKRDGI